MSDTTEKKFTQEELDNIIKDRLERQSKTHTSELASITQERDTLKTEKSTLQTQIDELNDKLKKADEEKATSATTIADLTAQLKKHETDSAKRKIAAEAGLSEGAVKFIQGDDEEAMKASAAELKKITGSSVPPLYSNETVPEGSDEDQAYRNMLGKLKQ